MTPILKTLAMLIGLVIFTNQLHADTNVLIIGSARSFSEGGESGVVHEAPFNPTVVATHLQGILSQDSAITGPVNVVFEDIYKTKFQTVRYDGNTFYDFTSHCYSLAQHYLWPEGKAARLANLRGEGARVWDYIVLCNDPYITANFPGMVAEGVKLIREEVAKSANPAQVLLLAQWPESTSTSTAAQFNEIAHRVGNSAGLPVVPAGKSWSSYGSKDTSSSHPTPRGEYLAAASIYSKIFNRSAKTSAYDFPTVGDAIADHALSEVQASAGVAQYTGNYTSFNPFQMKYLTKREVSYRHTGSSTEVRLADALNRLDDVHRITFNTSGYAGVPSTRWDFNYGRGNDWWEDDKDYQVDPNKFDWVYGFPMHHYNTTAPTTMPYGIDKHYYIVTGYAPYYEDGTDLGIPYNMIRPGSREPDWPEAVRALPIRLMWQKMVEKSPGFNPLADTTHMHNNLNDASAAFMYTLLSGRCPVVAEPAPQGSANPAWMQWLGHKIGYETAWQMSHLTTRAPGFRVLPSATGATTLTPTATETMTVNFANPPLSNVTVNVSVSNANAAGLSTQTLTFTPANYNVPQQVIVTGLAGGLASEAFNVVFSTVSADEVYNQISDSWGYTINRPIISTVTFDANGGTAASPASKSVTAGSTYGTLATTSRVGFTFNGWYTAASGGTVVTSATAVTASANHTLFAQWREVYTVTFDANGGTAASPASKSVTSGTAYGTLATTSRAGFTFNGWFTAASGGTVVTSATAVTASANHTLFAQWTLAATYTVSYLGNGNSGGTVPSNQNKTQGVNLVLATNTGNLSKTGFVFSGWNTAADGLGTAYAAGATYTGNAALTLHARWNVSPVVNAGSDQAVTLGASAPWSPTALAPQLWLDGSTATNNAGTISIANAGSGGGTVSGPAALAAGGIGTLQAVEFSGGTKYLTGDYIHTGTTLSAFFVGKSLNPSQTAYGIMSVWANGQNDWNNGGSAVLFMQNSAALNRVQTYRNATLSSPTGTLTAGFLVGTVFDGATNTAYLNGTAATGVASSGNFNAGKVVLGARRGDSLFDKPWNGNFGEAIVCNANVSAPDRQKVEGYLAHKWGIAGSLADGHPHKAAPPSEGPGAVATLDGTATDTDALTYAWSVVSGPASVTFVNPTAIDTSATFSSAGVYTLRLTANDGLAQASDDIVITVNAPAPNRAVTYNGNGSTGGTVPTDASSPYVNGSTVTVLGNTGSLVRTGHTFSNWNTAANGTGTSYSPAATFSVSAPTTLFVQWTINSYTITFNSAGGSAVTAITQNFSTNVTVPAAPTRSGYTFAGWSPALPSTMPANSQTVTAQWTVANNFAAWISNFSGLGGLTSFNDDADGDGVENGLEAFFGTAPNAPSGGLSAIALSGSSLTFRHPETATSLSNVTASYEWSLNLSAWNASGNTVDGTTVTIGAVKNTPVSGTTTVTATVTGTQRDRVFVRAMARQN